MKTDLLIIGSGMAGLNAIRLAKEKELDFLVVASGFGATEHFSGAFDLVDHRLLFGQGEKLLEVNLEGLLKQFKSVFPKHIYALRNVDSEKLLEEMEKFLETYKVPYKGNGKENIYVFGSSGRVKPTAFSFSSLGVSTTEINQFKKAAFLNFKGLNGYNFQGVQKNLGQHFDKVDIFHFPQVVKNLFAMPAILFRYFDDSENFKKLVGFLKEQLDGQEILFLPPILGIENYHENHKSLENELGVRIIELLSDLPSVFGMRFKRLIENYFEEQKIPFIKAKVLGSEIDEKEIRAVKIQKENEIEKIQVSRVFFSPGKFLGKGVRLERQFREPIFGLPLESQEEFIQPRTKMTQLIDANATNPQKFMRTGVKTNSKGIPLYQKEELYENLNLAGHILADFDFTRERCGFGVSILTSGNCFQ